MSVSATTCYGLQFERRVTEGLRAYDFGVFTSRSLDRLEATDAQIAHIDTFLCGRVRLAELADVQLTLQYANIGKLRRFMATRPPNLCRFSLFLPMYRDDPELVMQTLKDYLLKHANEHRPANQVTVIRFGPNGVPVMSAAEAYIQYVKDLYEDARVEDGVIVDAGPNFYVIARPRNTGMIRTTRLFFAGSALRRLEYQNRKTPQQLIGTPVRVWYSSEIKRTLQVRKRGDIEETSVPGLRLVHSVSAA